MFTTIYNALVCIGVRVFGSEVMCFGFHFGLELSLSVMASLVSFKLSEYTFGPFFRIGVRHLNRLQDASFYRLAFPLSINLLSASNPRLNDGLYARRDMVLSGCWDVVTKAMFLASLSRWLRSSSKLLQA